VGELGDVLELLHGAAGRYRTLTAIVRKRIDFARLREADWPADALNPPEPEPGDDLDTTVRLFFRAPNLLRLEGEDGGTTVLGEGGRWWIDAEGIAGASERWDYDFGEQWASNLLDPSGIPASALLEPRGPATQAGRAAVRVVAREKREPLWVAGLGPCDEFELLVDAEVGVLLRVEGRMDGEAVAIVELESAAFDEDLPDELFPAGPPADVPREDPEPGWQSRSVSVTEAAVAASFTVWGVSGLLDEWKLLARLSEREGDAALVELEYVAPDGIRRLTVTSTAASSGWAGGWTSYEVPRLVEHREERLLVLSGDPYTTELSLERGDARVTIVTPLALDDALDVVHALAPIPREPIRLS
jgi:hypothetical protein